MIRKNLILLTFIGTIGACDAISTEFHLPDTNSPPGRDSEEKSSVPEEDSHSGIDSQMDSDTVQNSDSDDTVESDSNPEEDTDSNSDVGNDSDSEENTDSDSDSDSEENTDSDVDECDNTEDCRETYPEAVDCVKAQTGHSWCECEGGDEEYRCQDSDYEVDEEL